MMSPQFDHLKPQIEEMVEEGVSYAEIGRRLGINHKTVIRTLKPEERKKHNKKQNEHYHKVRKKPAPTEDQKRAKKFESRCKRVLSRSKHVCKREGYQSVNATVKDLYDSYTGACHICGVAEVKSDRGLCVDHCHDTGKFRGWLCHRCNTGLGFLNGNLSKAITYLENKKG